MTTAIPLVEHFALGLDAPICLTWELTYACNLACAHCLSSSGRRDPRELTTQECKAVIDELQRMQVFYVNIGGGEPTVRSDFWELLDYAIAHDVGVKFSTNGVKLDKARAAQLAATDYVDVQISLDGATAEVNDHVRGPGSYATAIRAMENLYEAGFGQFKISVVVTRHNVDQLDDFKATADRYGAQLRITRFRPSGRGADVPERVGHAARQHHRRARADRPDPIAAPETEAPFEDVEDLVLVPVPVQRRGGAGRHPEFGHAHSAARRRLRQPRGAMRAEALPGHALLRPEHDRGHEGPDAKRPEEPRKDRKPLRAGIHACERPGKAWGRLNAGESVHPHAGVHAGGGTTMQT